VAKRIIDRPEELTITTVVIAEAAYVLRSNYGYERVEVLDALFELLSKENIKIEGLDKDVVLDGLDFCRPSNRVSVADALIWASARHEPDSSVFTFDHRFPGEDITVLRDE
jgi:predicted nucleic acid-binding protein